MTLRDPSYAPGDVENGVTVEDHLDFNEWLVKYSDDPRISFRATGEVETSSTGPRRRSASEDSWTRNWAMTASTRSNLVSPSSARRRLPYVCMADHNEAIEGALARLNGAWDLRTLLHR